MVTHSAGGSKCKRTCHSSEPAIFNADEDSGLSRKEPWLKEQSITQRMENLLLVI